MCPRVFRGTKYLSANYSFIKQYYTCMVLESESFPVDVAATSSLFQRATFLDSFYSKKLPKRAV